MLNIHGICGPVVGRLILHCVFRVMVIGGFYLVYFMGGKDILGKHSTGMCNI